MTGAGVTPSVNRSLPPKFSEMDSSPFEEMTCALVDKIDGVTRADLFRTQRQPQFGIDVFGETPKGLIVASCKCYALVDKGEVAQWSNDFLKHWDSHWHDKNILRFILAVAAPMNSKERLADIDEARALFKTKNVEYEVWAPRQLQERLRDHTGIVSEYLGHEWVERICGKSGDFSSAGLNETPGADADVREQLSVLIAAVSGDTETKLEAARASLDRGRIDEVEATLLALRTGPVWSSIEARVQGQAVRLQASLALERGDLDGAEAFAAEADAIIPADEPRLKALLILRREGAKRGLEVLGEPRSDAGRRLAAAMYLELGDIALVEKMLGAIVQDAEYYRLRTYLCLYQGDSAGALKAALAAEAADGEIVGVVRVGAIARYASALTPIADALYMTQPQPIARMFVRADDLATAHLEKALAGLERLTSLEADPRFRASDDLWRLACLCNLEGRGRDAEALAQKMLEAEAMNVAVIGWCVSRSLTFDRARSLSALRAAYEDGSIASDGVRALEWLWPDDNGEDLTSVLNAGRAGKTFADPRAPEEIDALLERLKGAGGDDAGRVQWATVQAARESGDWSEVKSLFDRLAGESGFEPALLFLGEELMSGGAAAFVFERRDKILAFATNEAARLAIYAAVNAEEPKVALELMESQLALFPGARLPFDLRRVEMTALSALGEAPRALEKAEALAAESNSPADKLLEANIRISMGDLTGAASAVRVALDRQGVAPQAALLYADKFASADPELARALWRSAVSTPLDDRLSMAALGISFRLGVEDERPDLFGAMHRLAARDGEAVRVASLDEVVEHVKDGKKRQDLLNRHYRLGAAPVHTVLAAANGDLASLYALEAKPGAHAVLLRHGARPSSVAFAPIEGWRLRMDVTALLVADALDLFDHLEALPNAIALGHNLPVLLATLEQKTQFHQPSRVVAARLVLNARSSGEIYEGAPPDGAIAVVFDIEDHAGLAVNLGAVLDALRRTGLIEARKADEIAKRDGWQKTQGPSLEPGAILVFEDHGLEAAADAGVLDAVTRTFKVYANDEAIQPCRDLDAAATAGDARAARLAALRTRLNAGIAAGKYRLLPARKADDDDDDLTAKALHEQMLSVMYNTGQGELVWFDERYISGYPNVDRGFIIGVTDVLAALRESGALDEASYFDRLARLRGAGALFIPITVEEVLYQLSRAPVIDGAVVETPALAALRRNFALAVLNEENLKLTDDDPDLKGRPLELPFLAENRRVADNAVFAAWRDTPDLAHANAHANWIWEMLRVEHAKFDASHAGFASVTIASLPASAMLLTQRPGEPRLTRLRAFMQWYAEEVVGQRLARDPALAVDVAEGLRTYLLSGITDGEHAGDRGYVKAITHVARRLIALMPDALRLDVLKDEAFRRAIRFTGEAVITLDGVQIPPRRLWRAAQNAVRHKHSALKTAQRKKLRLKVRPAEPRVMRFDGALKGRLHEPALALLDRDTPEVRAEIAALLAGADVPAAERDGLAAEWRRLWPHLRMEQFHKRRDASVPNYLHELYERLSKARSVDIAEFAPPSTSAWLDFLRWPKGDAGGEALANATATLVSELGMETAFERLSAGPYRLPKELVAGVEVDVEAWASPMHALHAMAAMGARGAADRELIRGANALAAMRQSHGTLFMTLLHWASKHFEARDDWRSLPARARHQVLWSAADQLTRVIARAGASPDFAQKFFDELHVDRPILPALDLLAGYHDTALDTRYLRMEPILLFGLMDALDDAQWVAVMSVERQKAWLDQFGMEREAGKKSLRPMRSFDGEGNWFDKPDWRDRAIEGATDGEGLFVEALAKLESDPNDRDAWVSVSAFGLPVTAPEFVDRINAVLARVDLAKIAADDEKLLAVRLIAEAVSRLGRGAQADTYLNALLDLARAQHRSAARLNADGGDADETVVAILEAALTGARGFEPGVGLTRLVDFVSRFVQVWPAAARGVQRIFLGLIEQAPAQGAASLWRPLWTARLF